MAETELPYPSRDALSRFRPRGHLLAKAKAARKTWRDRKDWLKVRKSVDLRAVRDVKPLVQGEIALIALCRDTIDIVEAFLNHYRALGVDRFILVDDRSSDGTHEYLTEQPDVDLHVSDLRYSQAARGRLWRETLLERYGRGRWYLNIDIDEFLVFPSAYGNTLRSLIAVMDGHGEKHLWAPMLDMLPDMSGNFDIETIQRSGRFSTLGEMLQACPFFDQSGYQWVFKTRQQYLSGGARQRIFDQTLELTKYPLLHADKHTNFGLTIHAPMPYWRNIAPARGVLLHFKYLPGVLTRTRDAVNDRQYFNGAQIYQETLEKLENEAIEWIDGQTTIRFEDADQLAQLGFVV